MSHALPFQHYLVLGLGQTGLSAARWLHAQGYQVRVADSRPNAPGAQSLQQENGQISLQLGEFNASLLQHIDCLVLSPGLPVDFPIVQQARQQGITVLGDVELFALACPPHFKKIAITGSNGKTTVTSMVGAICQASGLPTLVAGNIGLPVLDALSQAEQQGWTEGVFVLELSSFQLESTSQLRLDAAAMLNLSEDHLDRHGDMASYAAAKQRIFLHSHVQVLNRDDAASMAMRDTRQGLFSFALSAPEQEHQYGLQQLPQGSYLCRGSQAIMPLSELKLAGLHNAANALAAMALCHAIGISDQVCAQALSQFKGLAHRVEWVANIDQVDFYDDSKGTNVGATCAALYGFVNASQPAASGKVVLIAGGDGKGQDFSPLRPALQASARGVVLIGRDAQQIAAVVPSECVLQHAASLEQAVGLAFDLAQPKDCVLLSPACASFDMFKDYQHRAQVFISAVQQLAQQHARVSL